MKADEETFDPLDLAWNVRQQLQLLRAAGVSHALVDAAPGEIAEALRTALGARPQSAGSGMMAHESQSTAGVGAGAKRPAKPTTYSNPVNVASVAASQLAEIPGMRASHLKIHAEEVAMCAKCVLCQTRTQTVYSRGNPNSPLMLIGEAPGADEDEQGLPFVGRSGKLLDDILDKGMGYDPKDVYVANVLKCRPPNNRNPEDAEIAACRGYLEEQIRVVDPMVILALGRFPAQWLLESSQPIGKRRGKIWDAKGRKVVCTYHPAYLLRNPSAKKEVWKDVQLIMDFFGRGEALPMRS